MSTCKVHPGHSHTHGSGCGHKTIKHENHVDYLHDDHLHHVHGDHIDCHSLTIGGENAASCNPNQQCTAHDKSHQHGKGCGHDAVPHGDHICYVVSGHLHNPHAGHCDHHGKVHSS
jgi:hypothetical protein